MDALHLENEHIFLGDTRVSVLGKKFNQERLFSEKCEKQAEEKWGTKNDFKIRKEHQLSRGAHNKKLRLFSYKRTYHQSA